MRLTLLLLSLMFGFTLVVSAQNEPNSILFEMKDGSNVAFLYEDQPILMFNDKDIVVKTDLHEISYPQDAVQRYIFAYTETGLMSSPLNEGVRISGENLFLSDVKPGTLVTLIAIDGKVFMSDSVDAFGKCTISLSAFPAGVYLLNYSGVSVKLVKP